MCAPVSAYKNETILLSLQLGIEKNAFVIPIPMMLRYFKKDANKLVWWCSRSIPSGHTHNKTPSSE